MSIELVEKFLPYVDEQFAAESKLGLVTNQDFTWEGAHAVKVYKVKTAQMNDYGRSGPTGDNWSRYGAVESLNATTERMQLKRDRSFTFAIDKLDNDETAQQLAAASALARQDREEVIPEVDSYVYGVMCGGAGTKADAAVITAENVYDLILEASAVLDEAKVPESERVLIVTPAVYALMKKSNATMMETDVAQEMRLRGVIAMMDGMTVQKVPASRLPAGFGFMVCHPCATVAPVKLEDFKIHQDPPGISGSLVEGRIAYDAFVLENKAKGIYYQTIAATGLTVSTAAGSTSGTTKPTVTPAAESDHSYKYAVGATLPALGADCSDWQDWNGSVDIPAASGAALVIAEVDSEKKAVKAGSATVTAKA